MYENTFTFLNTALFEIRLPLQTNIVELALASCVFLPVTCSLESFLSFT